MNQKYDNTYPKVAFQFIEVNGPKYKELASLMGTTKRSIYTWIQKHKEFREAVEKAKKEYSNKKHSTNVLYWNKLAFE